MGLPLPFGDAEHHQTVREDRKGGERLPGVTGSVQGCEEALSFRGGCRGAIHTGILGGMGVRIDRRRGGAEELEGIVWQARPPNVGPGAIKDMARELAARRAEPSV